MSTRSPHFFVAKGTREPGGTAIAELPPVLIVLFLVLVFPLLDLTSACLRATFLYAAVNNATITAARARTFDRQIDGKPSTTQVCRDNTQAAVSKFTGIRVLSQEPRILITKVATLEQSIVAGPLSKPADTGINTYQLLYTVEAEVDPLIKVPLPADIPGISSAITLRFSGKHYFENPQGLTI